MTAGLFFMPVEDYSAYAAFVPAAEGLKRGLTFRIGVFSGGMTDVMIRPIVRAIQKFGSEVRTAAEVSQLVADEFYAMRPGTEALRPTAATPIQGLWLTGDYTRQPFLASMEGAVISGRRAASAILSS